MADITAPGGRSRGSIIVIQGQDAEASGGVEPGWFDPRLALPLTLTREQVTYFAAPDLRAFAPDQFPVWVFHGQGRTFYGFPVYGEAAVKAVRNVRLTRPESGHPG
jgi:hypothetical protein